MASHKPLYKNGTSKPDIGITLTNGPGIYWTVQETLPDYHDKYIVKDGMVRDKISHYRILTGYVVWYPIDKEIPEEILKRGKEMIKILKNKLRSRYSPVHLRLIEQLLKKLTELIVSG